MDSETQDTMKRSTQITTNIEIGQKMKLEYLARTRANGSDTDQAPYHREALELLFVKYNVPEEVPAP